MKFLLIALGGALGSVLRYSVSGIDYKFLNGVFPMGTLVVNSTGAFVIGFLWAFFERFAFSPGVRLFVLIGILGGYTTFSTFGLESFNLLRGGAYKMAAANIILSNLFAVGFVFLGYFASRAIICAIFK